MAMIALAVDDFDQYVSTMDPARKNVPVLDEKGEPTGETAVEIDFEDATVFELAPLDVRTHARINDSAMQVSQTAGVNMQMNAANVEIVRFGLRGWKNFAGPEGTPAKFLTQKMPFGSKTYVVPTDDTLSLLGTSLLKELANRIKEITQVSRSAAKN